MGVMDPPYNKEQFISDPFSWIWTEKKNKKTGIVIRLNSGVPENTASFAKKFIQSYFTKIEKWNKPRLLHNNFWTLPVYHENPPTSLLFDCTVSVPKGLSTTYINMILYCLANGTTLRYSNWRHYGILREKSWNRKLRSTLVTLRLLRRKRGVCGTILKFIVFPLTVMA